jgi:Ras-related protein Rab-11A
MQLLSNINNDDLIDYLIKISIVGNSNVGKTNIINRFTRNEFNLNTQSTIGVDFANKIINCKNKVIKTQIWVTAGQERYMSISNTFFRKTQGIIIVYDITDRKSFENIDKWIELINKSININECKILLVGNKSDLEYKRNINYTEGREKAEKYKINLFLETSALENLDTNTSKSIDNAFMLLIELIVNNIINSNKKKLPINNLQNINKSNVNNTKQKNCC